MAEKTDFENVRISNFQVNDLNLTLDLPTSSTKTFMKYSDSLRKDQIVSVIIDSKTSDIFPQLAQWTAITSGCTNFLGQRAKFANGQFVEGTLLSEKKQHK